MRGATRVNSLPICHRRCRAIGTRRGAASSFDHRAMAREMSFGFERLDCAVVIAQPFPRQVGTRKRISPIPVGVIGGMAMSGNVGFVSCVQAVRSESAS